MAIMRRYFLLLLLAGLSGCASYDQTRGKPSVCEVHHLPITREAVRVTGGDVSPNYQGTPFPHARRDIVAGCSVPEQTGFIYVCPECERLWREKLVAESGAQTNAGVTTPTNFVLQILEPTGGKIQRPKDWFYAEQTNGPSYLWTLSREDATKGRYTTGVRIQLISGIEKHTGKTPKEFIQEFISKKKQTADKVLKTCTESKQELFTRVCLETEEGPDHILYSLFWGNDNLDLVVVTIAGTTRELWDAYAPTFDQMGDFELIDMKRFEK